MTLDEFKVVIKRYSAYMTEQEIKRLYDIETGLANILFKAWIRDKNNREETTCQGQEVCDN